MTLYVNGTPRATESADVEALIAELEQPAQATLVEHNGAALLRKEWAATTLREGDRIELLRIVAGG